MCIAARMATDWVATVLVARLASSILLVTKRASDRTYASSASVFKVNFWPAMSTVTDRFTCGVESYRALVVSQPAWYFWGRMPVQVTKTHIEGSLSEVPLETLLQPCREHLFTGTITVQSNGQRG